MEIIANHRTNRTVRTTKLFSPHTQRTGPLNTVLSEIPENSPLCKHYTRLLPLTSPGYNYMSVKKMAKQTDIIALTIRAITACHAITAFEHDTSGMYHISLVTGQ